MTNKNCFVQQLAVHHTIKNRKEVQIQLDFGGYMINKKWRQHEKAKK